MSNKIQQLARKTVDVSVTIEKCEQKNKAGKEKDLLPFIKNILEKSRSLTTTFGRNIA